MLRQKIRFPLVESEFSENRPALQILLAEPLSFQEMHHIVAPRIGERSQGELLEITPVFRVSRIVEVFSAEVGV